MKAFAMKFNVENEAFGEDPTAEVVRILDEIATGISTYRYSGWYESYQTIHDVNGNDIGRFAIKENVVITND